MLSFFFDKSHVCIVYIVLSALVAAITTFLTANVFFGAIAFVCIFFIYIVYITVLFTNTWIIITPRRVIELTQNGFFKKHRRELKLMDVKATDSKK